jgi:hypothetical protein
MSDRLGGARIMPGKWSAAVQTSPELHQLLTNAIYGLFPHVPPLSPQQKKQPGAEVDISMRNQTRWKRGEHRKPRGYWTIGLVIQELHVPSSHLHDAIVFLFSHFYILLLFCEQVSISR